MRQGGPILVYSVYQSDIARFGNLLARELPDVAIHCATSPAEAAPHLADACILYGWGFPPEMLKNMPRLCWVQKMGAGVDEIIEHWPFGPDVVLTRTAGELIAPRMTEYALAAILDHNLHLATARSQQQQRHWSYFEVGTIQNLAVGIAGLGEIARLLRELSEHLAAASSDGAAPSAIAPSSTRPLPARLPCRASSAGATCSCWYCR